MCMSRASRCRLPTTPRAKGQQKKGAARLRRYDELVAQQAAYVKQTQVSV